MKEYFQSHTVSKVIVVLGIIIAILLIFQAGVAVGYHRGVYSYKWSMGYDRGMNDPRSIFAPFMRDNDDMNSHGALGQIVKIALPTLMLKGPNSTEQVITLSPTTTIRMMRSTASTSDLHTGDQIVVIGEPGENGGIDATFIRILPAQSSSSSSPTY